MRHDQFTKMPFSQQCLLIKHLAVEVAQRQDDHNRFFLYQLDSFYIEIKLQLEFDTIVDLISFPENGQLNNYLSTIDISDIINV